ncbi:MAG: zinc ribbon domain-containing protein [Anaerolineae bacterium]|nr:MAG: zinc ribbon domain-containing protein [Anaerolineae bacterium]
MADQSLFCPYCGAEQVKPDARFCHVCGQTLPARPAPVVTPAALLVAPGGATGCGFCRSFSAVAIAAMAFAWQRGLLGLSGPRQSGWTPAAISERSAGGSSTPGELGGAGAAPTSPGAGPPRRPSLRHRAH